MRNYLFLTDEIYSKDNNSGGLANYLHKVTNFLSNTNSLINIICFSDQNLKQKKKNIRIYYFKKIYFFNKRVNNLINLFILYPIYICYINFIIKKADILQYPNHLAHLSFFYKRNAEKVCRLSSISSLWRGKKNLLSNLKDNLEIYFIKNSDRIISPSNLLAKKLQKKINKKVIVLRTLIDNLNYIKLKENKKIISLKKYILFVGLLNERKGFVILLDFLEKYNYYFKEKKINFVIISQRNELDTKNDLRFKKLLKCKNIFYYKNLKKNLLYLFLSKSLLILIPSLIDNLPNILLESIKMKAKILTFKNNSIDEIIENNKTGFIINTKNLNKIFKTIIKIINLKKNTKIKINNQIKKLEYAYNNKTEKETLDFYENN